MAFRIPLATSAICINKKACLYLNCLSSIAARFFLVSRMSGGSPSLGDVTAIADFCSLLNSVASATSFLASVVIDVVSILVGGRYGLYFNGLSCCKKKVHFWLTSVFLYDIDLFL